MRKDWKQYLPTFMPYKGKYVDNWFSNMKESPFDIDLSNHTYTFKTVENFYQAMKTDNALRFTLIANAKTPYMAKSLGSNIEKPFDHLLGKEDPFTGKIFYNIDEIKVSIMKMGLSYKFKLPEWRERLLSTGSFMIIEWNNWGDKFWGVDVRDFKGKNILGYLLMEIRDEIKNKD